MSFVSLFTVKQVLSIALVLSVLFSSAGKTIVLTAFELNRDFIASTLCVEKEKPQNSCQGSCELAKSLEKEGQMEEKSRRAPSSVTEVQFFHEKSGNLQFYRYLLQIIQTTQICFIEGVTVGAIFQPPRHSA